MSNLKIFTENIEYEALNQIYTLIKQPAFSECKVRIMPDVHAGAGCVIGFTADLGERVIPNIVGVDIGCLDRDSEFLTPNGWKKMYQFVKGDKVLGYDKETGVSTFQTPLNYIKKPCIKFHHFKNSKGLDQMLSDEHKMLVFKGYKNKGYQAFDAFPIEINNLSLDKGYYSFETTFKKNESFVKDTDVEIQIAVMVAADACVRRPVGNEFNYVELHFKKQRKINRAKKLLETAKYQYKTTNCKDGSVVIYLNLPKKYNKDLTRFYMADSRQLKILAEESLFWDGHKGYRSYFSSTNKKNADVIQFAFSASGIRAGISTVKSKKRNENDIYTVIPTKNTKVAYTKSTVVNSVDGYKYCFTMPTGYFVARRNGKIFITGNCGMLTVELGNIEIDYEQLDKAIRSKIPSGRNVHDSSCIGSGMIGNLYCYQSLKNIDWLACSLGTLGGGNHFIEIDEDENGCKYLIIHTGSRNLGKQVAEYYQNLAISLMKGNAKFHELQSKLVEEYKKQGKQSEIEKGIKELKAKFPQLCEKIPKELCYLTDKERQDYLHDMVICQRFASENRYQIASSIIRAMGWNVNLEKSSFETTHNYIELGTNMIRKGAISAKDGEMLLIPINMRDGCIIGKGKGNPDWNYSAPHGAGRIMSRSKAKESVSLNDFKESMNGIFTTSVSTETIDESPMVYKPMQEIVDNIQDTVEIVKIIKPVYNFKAGD